MLKWFEIPVHKLTRARKFYEQILNLSMEEFDIGEATSMMLFPDGSGALVSHPDFYRPSENGVLIYLDCREDMDSVLDQVPRNGGEILVDKREISEERGFMAIIRDTEGNRIGLMGSK